MKLYLVVRNRPANGEQFTGFVIAENTLLGARTLAQDYDVVDTTHVWLDEKRSLCTIIAFDSIYVGPEIVLSSFNG